MVDCSLFDGCCLWRIVCYSLCVVLLLVVWPMLRIVCCWLVVELAFVGVCVVCWLLLV